MESVRQPNRPPKTIELGEAVDWEDLGRRIRQAADELTDLTVLCGHTPGSASAVLGGFGDPSRDGGGEAR